MTDKAQRIVFRHCLKTIECYEMEGEWMCAVQGEKNPRGPFRTPGEAVTEGIAVSAEQKHIKARLKNKKRARVASIRNPTLSAILRKADQ